jgi:hypothetical protein
LVIRILGVLTPAERQLGTSASPEKGRDLIKQVRKQLLELERPMLESLTRSRQPARQWASLPTGSLRFW